MKNIVLTGASTPIGISTIRKFQQLYSNCTIACITRNERKLISLFEKMSIDRSSIIIIECNLTDYGKSKNILNNAITKMKTVEILINIAGLFISKPFLDTDIHDFENIINTNFKISYVTTQIVLPYLLKNGSGCIINISSTLGLHTIKGVNNVIYDAAKAAIIQFTKSLAVELGPSNVRVNCICPGILNPIDNNSPNRDSMYEEIQSITGHLKNQPLKWFGMSDDIANGILFFSDEHNKWITGAILPIDGGMNL